MQTKLLIDIAEFAPLLVACSRRWRRLLDARLREHNLSDATATPLIALLRLGNDVPQAVLAERVGVERPSLVRVIDELESGGLIERIADGADRRINLIRLTKHGHRVAMEAEQCAAELRTCLLGDFNRASLAAALNLLQALAEKTASFTDPLKGDD